MTFRNTIRTPAGKVRDASMTMLSIRLSEELDARLNAESRSAGQPKSSLVRQALEQFLSRRKRERFLAGLAQAARALDAGEALEVAAEALPLDNEALDLTERPNPAGRRASK